MTNSARPLFFQQRFLPVWIALCLGTFADNTLRQALLIGVPYGIVDVPLFANPDNAMPFIGALLPLAIMLFSSVSGQLADRYETSFMFRVTKFTEIVLMTVAAVAFATGAGLLAIAMLFAMGAQSAFFSPVRVAAMPKYLAPDELLRGAGLCNAGLFTFILLGYAVGGYLIAQSNGGAKVGVVLILSAVGGWLAARRTLPAPAGAPDLKLSYNAVGQTVKMFRLVAAAPGVAPALIGVGVFYTLTTAVTVLAPLFARDTLGADPLVATALNGLFAVGAGIGAIAAASLAKGRSGLGFSAAAVITAGLVSFAIAWGAPRLAPANGEAFTIGQLFTTPGGAAVSLLFVAAAALMGVYIAPLQAALQRRAPAESRARIMAASSFANAACAIPGSLSLLLITRTGAPPTHAFAAVGLGMLAIGAVMLWRWRRLEAGRYDETLTAPPAPQKQDAPEASEASENPISKP